LATLGLFSSASGSRRIENNRALNPEEEKQIKDLVGGTLSLTDKSGKTLESVIRQEYTTEFNSKNKDRNLGKTLAVQLNKAFQGNTNEEIVRNLEKILNDKRLENFDLTSLLNLFQDVQDTNNKFSFARRELLGKTSGDITRRVAQAPEIDYQKIAVDNYKLIQSFGELDDELRKLGVRAESLTQTSIFNLGQGLERNISDIRTRAAIQISRTEDYNPFRAINIKRNASLAEIEQERVVGLQEAGIRLAPIKKKI
jgi:hypothetical protein